MGESRSEGSVTNPYQKIIQAAAVLNLKYKSLALEDKALLNIDPLMIEIRRNFDANNNNQQIAEKDMFAALAYVDALIDEIKDCRQKERPFRFTYSHLHRGRRCVEHLDKRDEDRKAGNKLMAQGIARLLIFSLGVTALVILGMFFPIIAAVLASGLAGLVIIEYGIQKRELKGPLHFALSASELYKRGSMLKQHRVGVSLGLAKLFPRLEKFAHKERPHSIYPLLGHLNKRKIPTIEQVEATYRKKIEKAEMKRKQYIASSQFLMDWVGTERNIDFTAVIMALKSEYEIPNPIVHDMETVHTRGAEYYAARIHYLKTSLSYAKKAFVRNSIQRALKYDNSLTDYEKQQLNAEMKEAEDAMSTDIISRPNKQKLLQAYSIFGNPSYRAVFPSALNMPDIHGDKDQSRHFPFEHDRRYHKSYNR